MQKQENTKPKVLTLWQPWASMYAAGIKKIETRPKATNYRGTYLIHAAQKWSKEQAAICLQEPFYYELEKMGFIHKLEGEGYNGFSFSFPIGQIIGAVEITDCLYIRNDKGGYAFTDELGYIKDSERFYGNYTPGRFAWIGKNHRLLKTPIPYKNGQGYYLDYKGDESLLSFK